MLTLQPEDSSELHWHVCVGIIRDFLNLPAYCCLTRGGGQAKKGLLLKPTGNLLKALHKAYLHRDKSYQLNPSSLAVLPPLPLLSCFKN